MSVSRHIALFSTPHCLNRIKLTLVIEIAAFSKCRICLHPHVSQMEHFSNGAILKWSISQMEQFSNRTFLKWSISQMKQFSNRTFLKWSISQMEQFSNRTFLKWSNSQMEHFGVATLCHISRSQEHRNMACDVLKNNRSMRVIEMRSCLLARGNFEEKRKASAF